MIRQQTLDNVGAPDPEANTSPIVEETDEEFELLGQTQEEQVYCYFNNVSYQDGSYVCSGSGELLRCDKGMWIREGGCDPDNP